MLCKKYQTYIEKEEKKTIKKREIIRFDKNAHLQSEIREKLMKENAIQQLGKEIDSLDLNNKEAFLKIQEAFYEVLSSLEELKDVTISKKLKYKLLFEALYFSIESNPIKVQFIRALVHKELLNELLTTSDQIYLHIESLSDEKWFKELMVKTF